jgi:hypothetical protein
MFKSYVLGYYLSVLLSDTQCNYFITVLTKHQLWFFYWFCPTCHRCFRPEPTLLLLVLKSDFFGGELGKVRIFNRNLWCLVILSAFVYSITPPPFPLTLASNVSISTQQGTLNWSGRLSTIDHLVKVVCTVKKEIMFSIT